MAIEPPNKYIISIYLFFYIVLIHEQMALAQIYYLRSSKDSKDKIGLKADRNNKILKIYHLEDTMYIDNFIDINNSSEVVCQKFLKIDYKVEVGSGIKSSHTILLTIKDGKLVESLHYLSSIDEKFSQTYDKYADSIQLFNEIHTYKAQIILGTRDNFHSYSIHINDTNISKRWPDQNYFYDTTIVIKFDTTRNIFYNKTTHLNDVYKIYNPFTGDKISTINENVPTIVLGLHEYYYIYNDWYEKGDENYLVGYSNSIFIHVNYINDIAGWVAVILKKGYMPA